MVPWSLPSSYQKDRDSPVIDVPDRNSNVAPNKENTMNSMKTPLLQHEGAMNSDVDSISDDSIRSTHSIQSGLPLHSMNPLPGMEIRCHQIKKNADLSPCSQHDALAGAKTGKKHYWVDIDADPHHASELRAWLQKLNLPKKKLIKKLSN